MKQKIIFLFYLISLFYSGLAFSESGLLFEGVYFNASPINPTYEKVPLLNIPFIYVTESNLMVHMLAPLEMAINTNHETYVYLKFWDGKIDHWAEGKLFTNVVLHSTGSSGEKQ